MFNYLSGLSLILSLVVCGIVVDGMVSPRLISSNNTAEVILGILLVVSWIIGSAMVFTKLFIMWKNK